MSLLSVCGVYLCQKAPRGAGGTKGSPIKGKGFVMTTLNDLGYKKVFVSLDGTGQQDKVLERAIVVAANNGAELYVGHVIDSTVLETAGTYPVDLIPGMDKAFRDSIAGLIERAQAEPRIPKVEVQVKTGRIRETLKDEMLDVIKPDLVLCGARGLSSIKYTLLGSISTFLLRNTDCDILVVK